MNCAETIELLEKIQSSLQIMAIATGVVIGMLISIFSAILLKR